MIFPYNWISQSIIHSNQQACRSLAVQYIIILMQTILYIT